jgi:hypothetical protein
LDFVGVFGEQVRQGSREQGKANAKEKTQLGRLAVLGKATAKEFRARNRCRAVDLLPREASFVGPQTGVSVPLKP